MSNRGKWDKWYESLEQLEPYEDTESYAIGASFLDSCGIVEDWGCGKGWFSKFRNVGYVGIDGSRSPFASKVADLEEYTSDVDGIFMRHVLEHDYRWQRILDNAIKSFRRRMVLVVFTPWSQGETREVDFISQIGVPDISFNKQDMLAHLHGFDWTLIELTSPETTYGVEHVFLIRKDEDG